MDAPVAERQPRDPIVRLAPIASGDAIGSAGLSERERDKHRPRIRLALMIGGVSAVALVSGYFWYTGGRYASTDDAYVRGAEVSVSTDVSGIVTEIDVHEGQSVKAGEVLFRIDPSQYQIALENAKATLDNTALNVDSMKVDYQSSLKTIAAQQAVVVNDQLTFDRYSSLGKDDLSVTQAMLDQARLTLEGDQQTLASLQKEAQSLLARLAGNADIPTEQHPQYLQAKAQVDEAQRQLDHTVVKAPFDGIVTRVGSLQPGIFLVAQTAGLTDQGAVALVSTNNIWIDANLKETDLTYVKEGDPVGISVDTYPAITWHGSVDSISPASASDFSILPAQNASGNWVKVVQRIPVRIRIEQDPGQPQLRSGMSVEVEIGTGHRRSLSSLF
jgi:membrane fusion protein, multidrug efflux system